MGGTPNTPQVEGLPRGESTWGVFLPTLYLQSHVVMLQRILQTTSLISNYHINFKYKYNLGQITIYSLHLHNLIWIQFHIYVSVSIDERNIVCYMFTLKKCTFSRFKQTSSYFLLK